MATENIISTALVITSVQKAIALILCAVFFSCISGCLTTAPAQNNSTQTADGLRATEISLSSASAALGAPVSLKAALKDSSGQTLNGKVVEWFIDGRSVGKSQMKNDVTTLMLTGEYTSNLGASVHEIQINFYGDADYKSTTATSLLTIKGVETPSAVASETASSTPLLRIRITAENASETPSS
jgi:hypothetical protein